MVVVVTYIRWRKGVKLPRLKMSPTIVFEILMGYDMDIVDQENILYARSPKYI